MTITQIATNVQALLLSSNYFATVLAYPPNSAGEFAGYPSASHYYVNTANDPATVSQNRRVVEYHVEIWLPFDKVKTDFSPMYAQMDNVIQLFDQSIDLSSQSLSLSPACDILRPAPGGLERVTVNEGDFLIGTVRLFCEADVMFR